MLLPDGIRRIPLNKVMPYNENDLLMFVSPNVAFIIFSLMDDNKQVFSTKAIMMGHKEVFACTDYEKAVEDFSRNTLKARLERFFKTKKSEYIYFDKEEQDFLKKVFEKNNLSGFVQICLRRKDGKFEQINFEEISYTDYKRVRADLRSIIAMYMITPERFMALKRVQGKAEQKYNPFSFKDMLNKKDNEKAKKILEKFPDFNVSSKKSVKAAYRMLSKTYHPDVNKGEDKMFKEIKEAYETLIKTLWFKGLREE
jgi:hypothetical protein